MDAGSLVRPIVTVDREIVEVVQVRAPPLWSSGQRSRV
jgi:hypothetical protein